MTTEQQGIGRRIRQLREKYEITQEDLALQMNMNRQTISSIEKGDRKVSTDEALLFARIFNLSVDQLLDERKEIEVLLKEAKSNRQDAQIRISVPQKNAAKFTEILLYILTKVGAKPNVGETVIYKLLYFIDFDFYEKYEEQLIGATYIKNEYGPTPIEFIKIVKQMIERGELERVTSDYFHRHQKKYLPHRLPDLSCLGAHEKEHIDQILARLSDMNAAQLSELSHNDVPWITAEIGMPIDYESVFYRTEATSVRDYD